MNRLFCVGLLACAAMASTADVAKAQVFIRTPGVQVDVGGPGVYIRAPFFRLSLPRFGPPFMPPPPIFAAPRPTYVVPSQPPTYVAPTSPPTFVAPTPKPVVAKKPVAEKNRPPTIQEFAKSFQPKEGHYKIVLLNPINGAATQVSFSLPAGVPKRINVGKDHVEFRYGFRKFVRIEFDQEGAIVIAR